MRVEQMRESRVQRLVGARRQIGGAVSCTPSDLAPALLAGALGPDGAMLTRQRRLVAEWDTCVLDGQLVHDWDAVVRTGRLADVSGAFAVAWLDDDGAVHLARDAAGERSLFYLRDGERFIFASTVRALVASGAAPATVDASALPAYLTYGYVPGRLTLVEGVREVLPGEHVTFAGGRVTTHSFWALPPEDEELRSDESYCSELRSLLEDSVLQRLPDGGPLAATLSGGIDSSVVVALARRLHDGPMTAYSLSFGPGIPNEVAFASLVAEHCRVPHTVIDLTPRSVIDRFDSTLGSLSTPIGEPLTVANALLFETIAADSPVALNGEGGDPCFGGPKNMPMLLREVFGPRPGETTQSFRERGYLATHKKCFDELDLIFAPDVATAAAESMTCELEAHFADKRWPTLVNRLTALNITSKGGHHILPKVDHLSRAAGVLARSPLFDRAVVEAATRMPGSLKLRGAVEKHALKQACHDLLPQAILDRPKSGMRVPVEVWLEGRFERFARERIIDGLAPLGLFRQEYLERLVSKRDTPVMRRGVKIWLLLSLEAWLRTVVVGPVSPAIAGGDPGPARGRLDRNRRD